MRGGYYMEAQSDPCAPPLGNPIACENQLPGDFSTEWDVEGAGDPTIQGFATDISVNRGQTVNFKIDTDATAYRLDIYRMGYYGGRGARKVATVLPSVSLPQLQPACLTDSATGLVDCGNWAVSASWTVPSTSVSGIYFAKVVRLNTGGASHIVFVVRNDTSTSDLLFQTSDTTWQAYNTYGGNSLYVGGPGVNPGRAYKVSYNRPFTTRDNAPEDWLFNAEYPMVRWLEANGYDVSYSTGVDSDRFGAEILEHRVFLSVGHDEYWSGAQRTAVENARNAGVHLAFFSGNEVFWKTRWENSIAPGGAPYRTLVSYKETHANAKIDPTSVWTGTWGDPRFSPPADGGRPQNALTGTLFTVNCCTYAIDVPAAEGKLRFWRNTSIANLATGQVASLPIGTLGYEWNEDIDNGFRPAGLLRLSDTVVNVPQRLQDYGSTYGPGAARHALTFYRHTSGSLVFGAGTVQWSWGLDGEHDRGASETSQDMAQATVNLLADMDVQPLTLQPGLATAEKSFDTSPPSAAVVSPAPGSVVQQDSVITVSGTAVDDGGGVVAGVEVSFDGGTTWRRASGGAVWTYSWATGSPGSAVIQARAVDDSGNLGPASAPVSVTIGVVPISCPCSIWSALESPTNQAEPDSAAVELGLKFRSSVDGYVSGVRFFKSAQNVGPHVGKLWTSGGVLLSSVTFSDETASGWQQADFATPIQITANTTYVVSYHTSSGFYSQDAGYFSASGVTNSPLQALGDGVSGSNGVYRYGPGGFPALPSGGSNYWVDVVFVTSTGPDTTPPAIISRVPVPDAHGVSVTSGMTVQFNELLSAGTVSGTTFQLRTGTGALVASTVTHDAPARTVRLQPSAPLPYNTTFTMTVVGGPGGVKDSAGNPLPADSLWSFTTSSPPPPPPTVGPGGPILVVTSPANPFSQYYAEILRAEGLNSFALLELSVVNPTVLSSYDVVILGEMPLSTAQVTMFSDWVTAGGNLIAMRPDKKLAGLLGLTDAGTTLPEAYLLIDTGAQPGAGLVNQTIQYHGTADRYTPTTASIVATLYSTASAATANPAVTVRSVGPNGGNAAAFTYDLARSVVYTRQGNPAWAGQERDGLSPIRSDDLFFGGSQPNWVDLDKVAIPQADEQQRLLANLISFVNADRKPLPRFWYFPRGHRAVVVMTGDDHAINGTAPMFDGFVAESTPGCSVVDWECIRATSYIYPSTPISGSQVADYVAQGFEVGVHITTFCGNYTAETLDARYTDDLTAFASLFPSAPSVVTNRTHCIPWSDYTTQADVALAHGIRLDTNYYYWPASWVNDKPGVFTGSGMPMRFARSDGSMIDVYQAATQMTDESGQTYPLHANVLLDRALGAEGYYGAFVANMHTDYVIHPGANAIVASAKARGVPVISAKQLLDWIDGRNASSFKNLTWNGSRLDFEITVWEGANGLQGMLPFNSTNGTLAGLSRDGVPVLFTTQVIKGVYYSVFSALPGTYQAHYAADTVPPVITGVSSVPTSSGAIISWVTDEPGTSVVHYGTTPGSLVQTASVGGFTNAHAVTLSGLASGTTYYYRVTSADQYGNGASAPVSAASFVTGSFAVTDTTVADFASGSPDVNAYVSQIVDGELMLKPSTVAEFSGSTLPTGWSVAPWVSGGGASVGGGAVSVSGALLATDTILSEPHSLEFVATFAGAPYQHAGFGITLNELPFAVFSTGGGDGLYARTYVGSLALDTPLGAAWLGTPHRFRIDWTPGAFVYSIDGNVVATHDAAVASGVRPIASDFATTDAPLVVDSVRVLPFATNSTFLSRVLDGGSSRAWRSTAWTAELPPGTSVDISVRFGNTAVPDGSWTGFMPAHQGGAIAATSRYVQYRSVLTGSGAETPVLMDVTISTAPPAPDTSAPIIGNISATVAASFANVAWTTSEPATSVVHYGVSPESLTQATAVSGLLTAHAVTLTGLVEGTTYYYAVTSADSAGNTASAPVAPLSFTTTVAAGLTLTDTSVTDFSAGTSSNLYTSQAVDGELIQAPAVGAEFDGEVLAAPWVSSSWTGGGGVLGGGVLTVDGGMVHTADVFDAGRRLDFEATFTPAPFQHAGFALTFNEALWAMFSTGSGGALYARTHNGAVATDTQIPGNWLNAPHVYRIDWLSGEVVFYIDGVVVATHPVAVGGSMRPVISDFNLGDGALSLNWLRMTPYASPGVFVSRVLDAGSPQPWATLTWTSQQPSATSVALAVRFGDTPTPDGSWTAFAPVASSGDAVVGTSRYVQYQATLTGDGSETPRLDSVTVASGPPPAQLSVSGAAVSEGQTGTSVARFTVALARPSAAQVSVSYATANGTASAGSDYTAVSGVLTFAPGVVTRTVEVPVSGDTAFEADETFFLNLSSPVGAPLGTAQGLGMIVNDDPLPSIAIAGVSLTEGNSGTKQAPFILTLSNPSSQAITVAYATIAGTATAGSDYVTASGTVTFAAGTTQQTINVSIIGDSAYEPNETFAVNLSNPTNATLFSDVGTGTIVNDDPVPTLSINSATVTEGNSVTVTATFTVTLSPTNPFQTVTVDYATANGTATAGADYTPTSGTLTFTPGQTTRTITVSVLGDTLDEDNETFFVNLTGQTNAIISTAQGVGTITDNDATPSLSINNVTVSEDNSGSTLANFTVTLSAPSGRTVAVNYSTANNTATAGQDYTSTSGTLTFAPGETAKTIAVAVLGDTLDEDNETFRVNLSSAINASISTSQGTGTITDNDPTPTLAINDVSLTEGNSGTKAFTFAVTLSAASGRTVTVNYATANGTATAGTTGSADYIATSGTVTFSPGTTTQNITVSVRGDTTVESDETFAVNLSSATNATIADSQGAGTIVNDDLPTLTINDVTVTEGNTGSVTAQFTVTLSPSSAQTVTVNYATANGTATAGADYTSTSGTLSFTPGSTTRTISVTVLGDVLDEDNETFAVNLSGASNATIATASGTGTITDNDATPSLGINSLSLTEGNSGTTNLVFTVTLSTVSGRTVTVNYATANGTATAPADYTATSGVLTFAPGTTTQQVSVAVLGDLLDEDNETFAVNLSGASNATIATATGTGTITDNDPTPTLAINNVSLTEGNSGTKAFTFAVTLSAASGRTVTVNYATANGTATAGTTGSADYIATSGTLTFSPGTTTQNITVSVRGDTTVESDETFAVNLSSATNATIADSQGAGTIVNDDLPTLTINDVTVTEGNTGSVTAQFTVTLSPSSAQTVTVNYATANGTATAGADYTSTSGTLSFTPGSTTRTISVTVLGDVLDEDNETFAVNLSGASNATIATASGTGTITDNDPTPTLAINDVSLTEGNSGTKAFTFTVTLSATSGRTVTVNYATANGTATAGTTGSADYIATSGTLTFNPGTTTQNITVLVRGDTTDESNQTFFVNLSGASNATTSDSQGQGTILNDD